MLVQQRIQQDFDTAADVASTPELWCLKKIKSKKSLLEFKMAGKCLFEQYRSTALEIPWQCVSKKNCQKFSRNLLYIYTWYVSLWQWLWHTSAFCQGIWSGFLTVDTTYSTNMIYFACNTLKQEKEKTIFVPLINIYYLVLISLFVLVIIWEHILQC